MPAHPLRYGTAELRCRRPDGGGTTQSGGSSGGKPGIGAETFAGGAWMEARARRPTVAPSRCATVVCALWALCGVWALSGLWALCGLRSRSTERVNRRVLPVIRQVTTAKARETIPRPMWMRRKDQGSWLMIMLRISTIHTQAVQITDARSSKDARRLMAPW